MRNFLSRCSRRVNESVVEGSTDNMITFLHDKADLINDVLARTMHMSDEDFAITLTRWGLWIEWKKNPSYGVSVGVYRDDFIVTGHYNEKPISERICKDTSVRGIVNMIDKVADYDGKIKSIFDD